MPASMTPEVFAEHRQQYQFNAYHDEKNSELRDHLHEKVLKHFLPG